MAGEATSVSMRAVAFSQVANRIFQPVLSEAQKPRRPVHLKGLGVETKAARDFGRRLVVTTVFSENSGLYGMGLGQIGVQCKGAFRGRQAVLAFSSMNEAHDHLAKSHQGPGLCIVGIDFRDAVTDADGCFHSPQIAFTAGDVVLARHQIEIVSLDTLRAALLDGLLLLGKEFQL